MWALPLSSSGLDGTYTRRARGSIGGLRLSTAIGDGPEGDRWIGVEHGDCGGECGGDCNGDCVDVSDNGRLQSASPCGSRDGSGDSGSAAGIVWSSSNGAVREDLDGHVVT